MIFTTSGKPADVPVLDFTDQGGLCLFAKAGYLWFINGWNVLRSSAEAFPGRENMMMPMGVGCLALDFHCTHKENPTTGGMRHQEEQRRALDVSEQRLELFCKNQTLWLCQQKTAQGCTGELLEWPLG